MTSDDAAEPYARIVDQYRDIIREQGRKSADLWVLESARAIGRDSGAPLPLVLLGLFNVAVAHIPHRVPLEELRPWLDPGQPWVGHGPASAVKRHSANDEPCCEACRAYLRGKYERRKAVAAERGPDAVRDPLLIDEVAVERACRGERVNLTRRERRAAVAKLTARGAGVGEIAEVLRMAGSTVLKYQQRDESEAA